MPWGESPWGGPTGGEEQLTVVQGIEGEVLSKFDWKVAFNLATPLPPPTPNLLSANQSSMETDASSWVQSSMVGPVLANWSVIGRQQPGFIGDFCQFGLMETDLQFHEISWSPFNSVPVTPGETYEMVGYIQTGQGLQVAPFLFWLNATGAVIGAGGGQNLYLPQTDVWHKTSALSIAPVGAVYARGAYLAVPVGTTVAVLRFDAVSFKQRS